VSAIPVRLFLNILGLDFCKIQVTTSTDEIHIHRPNKTSPLQNLPEDVETEHDGSSKVGFKEGLSVGCSTNRPYSDIKLGNKAEDVEKETEPGSIDSTCCSEGKFIERMSLKGPRSPETNVCKAN